jgi:hypothetical protein
VRDDELTLAAEKERTSHSSKHIPVFFLGSHNYGFCLQENICDYKKNLQKHSMNPSSKKEAGFDLALQEGLDPEKAIARLQDVLARDKLDRERKQRRKEATPRRKTNDVVSPKTHGKKLLLRRATMDAEDDDGRPVSKRSRSLEREPVNGDDVDKKRKPQGKEDRDTRKLNAQSRTV